MTQTVGNYDDARLALECASDLDLYNTHFLGEGSYRQAFLINGVVYKIDIGNRSWIVGNDAEWNNYLKFKDIPLPANCGIPQMSMYEIDGEAIIAAEYIKGSVCWDDYVSDFKHAFGVLDAWGNTIISNGRYFLIDLTH